jgi:hypothetical protein
MASDSASPRAPRSRRISARCTRHRPWILPMALVWHHRSMASVHSSAASYCPSPCNAHTSSQYTTPVDNGSRSPETVATPTAFSSANPRSTSPSRMHRRASATRPRAHAAGSVVVPTSIARCAHSRAPSESPTSIRSYARTAACQASADVGARPSSSCCARANQPRTGAMRAVSNSRCIATRAAAPAAATGSPAAMHAAWTRSHTAMVTSRYPAA